MMRVAVIGAGLMGHGIAQVFAVAGHRVSITDEDTDVLSSVPDRVRSNLTRAGGDPAAAETIELHTEMEPAVAEADLVIEAVAENLELKQSLFAHLSLAAPSAILATNTSVLPIGEIARDADDPSRVVGTHFWNPPHLIPLVEVTQAAATSPEVVRRTMDVLVSVGKSPVHVKRDIAGFVGNRLQHALWREAIALVEHGVCDAKDVDDVIKLSFGLRLPVLGPTENADLIGLDLTLAIHEYVLPHIDSRPAPSPLLGRLVERGDLGMKTGRGLHDWTGEQAEQVRERLFDHLVAVTRPQHKET